MTMRRALTIVAMTIAFPLIAFLLRAFFMWDWWPSTHAPYWSDWSDADYFMSLLRACGLFGCIFGCIVEIEEDV